MDERVYRQFAELDENHWWFRARRRIFLHVLDRVAPAGAWRVLDVGCGAGNLLARLRRYGASFGVEPSRELAALAQERVPGRVARGSALGLPLADATFDLACLFDTLEHIPEEHEALCEVARVLRPGGLVFITVPAYEFLWTNNDHVAQHCRRYTAGRLERALRGADFEVLRTSYFNTLLFPVIVVALLFQKAKERWVGLSRPDETNLTRNMPPALAELLRAVMASERHWLGSRRFPVGHSLIALARRPPGAPGPLPTGP